MNTRFSFDDSNQPSGSDQPISESAFLKWFLTTYLDNAEEIALKDIAEENGWEGAKVL